MGMFLMHMEATLLEVASAAVTKEIRITNRLTGTRMIPKPNGMFLMNSNSAMTALEFLMVATKSSCPLICIPSAVLPQTENQMMPNTAGRIKLTIRHWRMVRP